MKTAVNNNESLINFLMVSNPNKIEVIRDIYECSLDEQNYGPKDNSFYVCKKNMLRNLKKH